MSSGNSGSGGDNGGITKTIEEIAPDDQSTSEDLLVVVESNDNKSCPICGFNMVDIKPCMQRCQNCGSVKDCSEKGIW